MGTPNEFTPSALYGYQQNQVAPYTHQATQPNNANYPQFANNGTTNYFNGNGFFTNSLNHNSLHTFHENSARTPCFNANTFAQEEPQSDTAMNMYDGNATQNTVYWSQQPQLSPFGVLPHEISAADHHVDQSTMYENAQSVHFVTPHASSNTGNVATTNDFCGKTDVASGKSRKALIKSREQYISKPMADIGQNSVAYSSERMSYCNGVINHGSPRNTIDQNRLMSVDKIESNHDYRTFPGLHAPEYTGEPSNRRFPMTDGTASPTNNRLGTSVPPIRPNLSELRDRNRSTPFIQQNMTEFHGSSRSTPHIQQNMTEYHDSSRSSPHLQQNMTATEYHDSSRSSPLVQQNISEYHDSSRSSPLVQQNMTATEYHDNSRSSPIVQQKMSEFRDGTRSSPHAVVTNQVAQAGHCESPFLNRNHANIVPHANLPLVYCDTQNVGCRNTNENRVTSPYLKLPYTTSAVVNSSSANTTEVGHLNQSFYAAYNSSTNNSAITSQPKEPPGEKSSSTLGSCLVEGRTNFPNKMTDLGDGSRVMAVEPTTTNDLVRYPSVIMRTDENFENNGRNRSTAKWESSDSIASDHRMSPVMQSFGKSNTTKPFQRQRDPYFRESSCSVGSEIAENVRNDIPVDGRNADVNVFDGTTRLRVQEQQYQCNVPTISALPVNEPVAKLNSPKCKTSGRSTIVLKSTNTVTEYDISPTFTNTYSEPRQNIGSNTVTNHRTTRDERVGIEILSVHSPRKSDAQNNPNSRDTNSTANVSENNPPRSDKSYANFSSDPSQIVQATMPSSSIVASPPPARRSTTTSSTSQLAQSNDLIVANVTEPDKGTQSLATVSHSAPTSCPENVLEEKTKKVRVIVPNVEEEFRFLFDPELPNYAQIAYDENFTGTITKSLFRRKNVDFLNSYIKFLENNCESVERLTDSYTSVTRSWFRSKTANASPVKDEETSSRTTSMTEENPPDFENDPRYYPLPKTSDERRLTDTSCDEEDVNREKSDKLKSDRVLRKPLQSLAEKDTKSVAKKEENETKSESTREEDSSVGYAENVEEIKSKEGNEAEKKKEKHDVDRKSKSKKRKVSNEDEECVRSVDGTPEYSANNIEERFGRKVSLRKAKIDVKEKIKKAVETDNEESAVSDPSWSPRSDDKEESASTRKSSRVRVLRFGKLSEPNSSTKKDVKNGSTKKRNREHSDSETNEDVGSFFVEKSQIDSKKHPLWRLNGGKLQKFEHKKRDGKQVFSSVSQYVKISNSRLSKYEKVQVHVVHQSKSSLIVELFDDTDTLMDAKARDDFMNESLRYESQFAVYVQTLVSQALDSNFLSEIVRENDTYFLDNMKVIEDVTATYVNDLTSVIKCDSAVVDLLMKTWPFLSIETRSNDSRRGSEDICTCCSEMNACKTAIFYGQPYKRETLQGCTTNIPNNIDKTADLCKGCAKKIQLFNKIWHQKYHLFVECATCVSKKKTQNKNKVTTDILNDLLADNLWLSKLFHGIRNTWLMVWTVVQKTRKKLQ